MSTNLLLITRFFRLNLFPQIKNLLPRAFCHFKIFYRNKKKYTLSNDWDKSLEDLRSLGFANKKILSEFKSKITSIKGCGK